MTDSLTYRPHLQGSLYDVYTHPKFYANLNTLKDVDEAGIPISVTHLGLIVDVFGDELPGTHLGNLRAKLKPRPMDDFLIAQVAAHGKEAALERFLALPLIEQQYMRPDGQSYLHRVSECPR